MGLHPSELFSYRVAVRRCPAPIPSWRWSLLDSISIASSLLSAEASSNHWTTATFPPEQKAPSFQQLPSTPPSGPKPIRKVRRALRSADARRLRRIAELPAGAAPEGSVQRTSARPASNPKVFGGPDTPPACAATRRSMARFERLHSLPIQDRSPFLENTEAAIQFVQSRSSFLTERVVHRAKPRRASLLWPTPPSSSWSEDPAESSVLPICLTETEIAMKPDDLPTTAAARRLLWHRTSCPSSSKSEDPAKSRQVVRSPSKSEDPKPETSSSSTPFSTRRHLIGACRRPKASSGTRRSPKTPSGAAVSQSPFRVPPHRPKALYWFPLVL
jgi:hypothetical protein